MQDQESGQVGKEHSSGEGAESLVSQEQGSSATERPWRVGEAMDEGYSRVILAGEPRRQYDDLDRIICYFKFIKPDDEVEANAELIVRAVNSHDALVAALEDLVHQLPNDERLADFNLDHAEAALALARGDRPATDDQRQQRDN